MQTSHDMRALTGHGHPTGHGALTPARLAEIKFSRTWQGQSLSHKISLVIRENIYPSSIHMYSLFLSHRLHGIVTYIYLRNDPDVGKYSIHGAYGYSSHAKTIHTVRYVYVTRTFQWSNGVQGMYASVINPLQMEAFKTRGTSWKIMEHHLEMVEFP